MSGVLALLLLLALIAARRFEDHRRPFDTLLRTGIEDPPVIVKILSHLGLPTRAAARTPARRVDLFQTI